jgi:16S rRNA (cytidine1402-2'-O)-methyltransferase
MSLKPGLYIVSTPIGNLQDITLRAIETLKNSQYILCEDTRVSQKLLAKIGIKSNLLTYNDFSNSKDRDRVKQLISQDNVVSLISDAGTPLISDPGYKLVSELKDEGYYIDIAPGPSSPIAALTLSGLPTDKFYFGGFIPKTLQAKENLFNEVAQLSGTLIFFETASRLQDSIKVAHTILGNRKACIARELTKLYQEALKGTLEELLNHLKNTEIRGEIVLLISGFEKSDVIDKDYITSKAHDLRKYHSAKDTVAIIYNELKDKYEISKSAVYDLVKNIAD